MSKFLQFFHSMLAEKSGATSAKRVVGFAGFITLIICLFLGDKITPNPLIIDSIMYVTIGSLLGTSVEKFFNKNKVK